MRYWCSRPHDWEGVLTTANHDKQVIDDGPTVETEEEALAESQQEVVEEPEDKDGLSEAEHAAATDISGFHVYSQLVFIEYKNNGLGDMRDPTIYWTKKSSHVVFRRPLNLEISDRLELVMGETYHFNLQWGLFDSPEDDDQAKVMGDLGMGTDLLIPIILSARCLAVQTLGTMIIALLFY